MSKIEKDTAPVVKEVKYTIEEFKEAARTLFGCNKACVEVALKKSGIVQTTEAKAKKIVEEFLKKEVEK